jgi:hypothetical protein
MPNIRTLYLCEQRCVCIRGYFSKSKVGRELKRTVKHWNTLFPEINKSQCNNSSRRHLVVNQMILHFMTGIAVIASNRQNTLSM